MTKQSSKQRLSCQHYTCVDTDWYAEQSRDGREVNIAIAAAQQAASRRAAESRAQAAMMVEAVEDRAYEVTLHSYVTLMTYE